MEPAKLLVTEGDGLILTEAGDFLFSEGLICTTAEIATVGAAVVADDVGVGADAANVPVRAVGAQDSGIGSEALFVIADGLGNVVASDSGVGTEIAGACTQGEFPLAGADTLADDHGAGTEDAIPTALLISADSGSGSDSAEHVEIYPKFADDSGVGAEIAVIDQPPESTLLISLTSWPLPISIVGADGLVFLSDEE